MSTFNAECALVVLVVRPKGALHFFSTRAASCLDGWRAGIGLALSHRCYVRDQKGHSTMTTASRKRFLNVDEAAEYLQTTRRNIYRLAEQNRLAHHRIARRLQFTVSDLEKYIECQRVEAQSWEV